MKNIINDQERKILQVEEEYKKISYDFNNPFIKLDPLQLTPLCAVVKFNEKGIKKFKIIIEDDYEYCIKASSSNHELNIVALYPNKNNKVSIIAEKNDGSILNNTIFIQTENLPTEYNYRELVTSKKEYSTEGFITICLAKSDSGRPVHNLFCMVDYDGNIRWYYTGKSWNMFKQLKNGNLVIDAPVSIGEFEKYTPPGFIEIDFKGKIIDFYPVPNGLHHDAYEMSNGNFLALTQNEDSIEDVIVEIHRDTKEVVSKYDFKDIFDVERETVIDKVVVNHPKDWLHLNSVVYKEDDNSIIISSRNQSMIAKIDKDTNKIKWILSPHEGFKDEYKKYLLKPIGDNFNWSWAQHTAIFSENSILAFDNGNYRSFDYKSAVLAHQNYSRGVEYIIDEDTMQVKQVWEYGKDRGSELYCPYLCSIALLENGNRLMCFGGAIKDRFGNPSDDMKNPRAKARTYIIEVTNDEKPKVVFEMSFIDDDITTSGGFLSYRANKINFYKQ